MDCWIDIPQPVWHAFTYRARTSMIISDGSSGHFGVINLYGSFRSSSLTHKLTVCVWLVEWACRSMKLYMYSFFRNVLVAHLLGLIDRLYSLNDDVISSCILCCIQCQWIIIEKLWERNNESIIITSPKIEPALWQAFAQVPLRYCTVRILRNRFSNDTTDTFDVYNNNFSVTWHIFSATVDVKWMAATNIDIW